MKDSSIEDMLQSLKSSSKELYTEGASWNGYWIAPVAVVLIIGSIIGYVVWWDKNHTCVETQSQYICRTYNNCQPSGSTYGGQVCYSSYSTCGYEEVCTRYEEK
jgi:hypothetical protein